MNTASIFAISDPVERRRLVRRALDADPTPEGALDLLYAAVTDLGNYDEGTGSQVATLALVEMLAQEARHGIERRGW